MNEDVTPPAAVAGPTSRDRVWTVATQSTPIMIQLVLGVLLISTWLLSRWSLVSDTIYSSRWAVLGATGIPVVISFVVAAVLLRGTSSTARGLGLSAAGCAVVALIGAVPYAFWLL